MDSYRKLSRSVRVWVLALSLVISLLLLFNIFNTNKDQGIGLGNGLVYGLDFAGGTQMWLKLENPVTPEVMAIERGILENRLNSYGLKDIPVSVYGDQHIIVKIAKASPEEIKAVEDILKQQARFEQRIDGELAIKGSEITIDLSSSGSGISRSSNGYEWFVGVKFNQEGACRFGSVAEGKFFGTGNDRNRPVDLFIDRPENTTLLVTESFYGLLANTSSNLQTGRDIYFGDSALKVIENRSRMPVIVLNEADLNKTLEELEGYKADGYVKVVFAEEEFRINNTVKNEIQELGIEVSRNLVGNESVDVWIMDLTGLKSSPRLNFDTQGQCVYSAVISGFSQTLEDAEFEIKQNQIWLTSGNLPAKAYIESKSTVPASLGAQFLRYSLITGLIGILSVSFIIFFRYKKLFIVVPTLITGLSEIIIILGVAVLIKWEIDLPAIAGIIAALGTGVDNQIVITDETLASRSTDTKKTASVSERIRRAFFIIFTSAATIIAVMLPLMTFVAGTLKGFALITILGVLIGVFITRPAFSKIIEEFMKRE